LALSKDGELPVPGHGSKVVVVMRERDLRDGQVVGWQLVDDLEGLRRPQEDVGVLLLLRLAG